MDSNTTPIEALIEKAEGYKNTTIELYKLKAIDKSAEVVSSLAVRLVIFMVVALCILIMNIGMALWLGELLGKLYYGFFVVAGLNVLVAFVFYYFRKPWIKVPVSNSFITQMLNQKLA